MAGKAIQSETLSDRFLDRWEQVGQKLATMAEVIPEDKLDYRPVQGVRTFGEVLRHVAFWNRYVADRARGGTGDDTANELPSDKFFSKKQILDALKKSTADALAALKKHESELSAELAEMLVMFIEHKLRALRSAGGLRAPERHRAACLSRLSMGEITSNTRRQNMSSTQTQEHESFESLLSAPGCSDEIPQPHDIYGWLVGSWELDVLHYRAVDVSAQKIRGEAHFAWVLEGRAIQDVWIMPSSPDRRSNSDPTNNMYGTTLRIWDPAIDAWRIRWVNPVNGHEERQTGRRIGNEIVQIGARIDGTPTRWRFTEITPSSFHWIGEALQADGKTWKLEGEFLARRCVQAASDKISSDTTFI